MYKLVIIFVALFSRNIWGMTPSLLSSALFGEKLLHIVTLTRAPVDNHGDISADSHLYLPISASEAATVFAITNYFLGSPGDKFKEEIRKANEFDQIEKQSAVEYTAQRKRNREEIILAQLSSLAVPSHLESWKERILHEYKESKTIVLVPSEAFVFFEDQDIGKRRLKKNDIDMHLVRTIESTTGILGRRLLTLLENNEKIESKCNYKGEVFYKISGTEIPSKIKVSLDAILSQKLPVDFSKQFLVDYAAISVHDVDYYETLYQQATGLFVQKVPPSAPCMFVSNELFLGKNFIVPNEYHTFIPSAPENVLSCINFLSEEPSQCKLCRELSSGNEGRFSGRKLNYEKYKRCTAHANKFFRSVSMYKVGSKTVQSYTKGSYYEECDLAIETGQYAYLFGDGFDSTGIYSDLISTQICFDTGVVRIGQKELSPLIHIIQSNTKEVSQYILPNDGQPGIPGRPEIIIHADPERKDVYLSYPCHSLVLGKTLEEVHRCYASTAPKETFTFIIKEGNRRNAYTITHWELNLNLRSKAENQPKGE